MISQDRRPPQPSSTIRPWEKTGRCSIDALLVWVYRDQKAGIAGAGGSLFEGERAAAGYAIGSGAQNMAMILQHERLGTHIDTSRSLGFDLHPVAETVHGWVESLPADDRQAVISHASADRSPVCPNSLKPRLKPAQFDHRRGVAEVERRRLYVDGRMVEVTWCNVLAERTREHLLVQARAYVSWALALNSLAHVLAGCELGFEIDTLYVPLGLITRIEAEAVEFGAALPVALRRNLECF